MNERVFLKSNYEKVLSLIADDAKSATIIDAMLNTLQQLRAKNAFRLALLNQIREEMDRTNEKGTNK
jgi:hypothetical protein